MTILGKYTRKWTTNTTKNMQGAGCFVVVPSPLGEILVSPPIGHPH